MPFYGFLGAWARWAYDQRVAGLTLTHCAVDFSFSPSLLPRYAGPKADASLVWHWLYSQPCFGCSALSLGILAQRTRLSTVGDRAFPATAFQLWNTLPLNVTSASSMSVFRKRLKTPSLQSILPPNLLWSCAATVISDTVLSEPHYP